MYYNKKFKHHNLKKVLKSFGVCNHSFQSDSNDTSGAFYLTNQNTVGLMIL